MAIIDYENLPSENTPLTGGVSGNLNVMQENGTTHGTDTKLGYSQAFLNDHLVNVSNEVDEDYRVNLLYSPNIWNEEYKIGYAWNNQSGFPSRATGFIEVKPNTKYTIVVDNISNLNGGTLLIFELEYAGSPSESTTQINVNGSTTITTTSNTNVLSIQFTISSGDISASNFANVMIVEGEGTYTYQPYITPSINVDGEDIFYSNTYSTAEQIIGKWIDGKPIYRKVVTGTTTSNANSTNLLTNIDTLINYSGSVFKEGYWITLNSAFGTGGTQDIRTILNTSNNTAILQVGTTYYNCNYKIILEYTKTTN